MKRSPIKRGQAVRRGDEQGESCGRCQTPNRPARSFCRGCGAAIVNETTLQQERAKFAIPRKRARRISPKRQSAAERRQEVVRLVHDRDLICQAAAAVSLAQVPHGGSLAVHELVPRSQWAAGYLQPDNCILICATHHDWVHDHPYAAHALGLLKWSYERGT